MRFCQRSKKLSRHADRNSALYNHNRRVSHITVNHSNCAADMQRINLAVESQGSRYAYKEVRRVLEISLVV
jgi:hypothetical protein